MKTFAIIIALLCLQGCETVGRSVGSRLVEHAGTIVQTQHGEISLLCHTTGTEMYHYRCDKKHIIEFSFRFN